MGTSHLSIVGCQLAQPWLAFHKTYPLLLWQPGKNLPAFVAMKDERPALMARPDVPSLVKCLRGVGRGCVTGVVGKQSCHGLPWRNLAHLLAHVQIIAWVFFLFL